jgi:tellurite resistance protein
MINHHAALIYTMVLVSAADRNMTDAELGTIGDSVRHLPIFADYDVQQIAKTAAACAEILNEKDGFEKVMGVVKEALPRKLRETAYALACDVAAADGKVTQDEARLLDAIRDRLELSRLVAVAIERGARARHLTL